MFNQEVGSELAAILRDIERQIRGDRRSGRLEAAVVTELPSWAPRNLPYLDDEELAEGRRRIVVVIPRLYGSGQREPIALALFDVTDAVFGPKR